MWWAWIHWPWQFQFDNGIASDRSSILMNLFNIIDPYYKYIFPARNFYVFTWFLLILLVKCVNRNSFIYFVISTMISFDHKGNHVQKDCIFFDNYLDLSIDDWTGITKSG